MKIEIFQPYGTAVFKGVDEDGDSLYPEIEDLVGPIEVYKIEDGTVFFPDGRHTFLFPSEYKVIS